MHKYIIKKHDQGGSMTSGLNNIVGGITGGGGFTPSSPWSMAGQAADMIGLFIPLKSEYSGNSGAITAGMDAAYDGISDAAMAVPPVGTMLGGMMKAGKLLGKGINALGGGTDGETAVDAIFGSSFLNLTPFGLINGFGGKKADTFTKNYDVFGEMAGSYSGSNSQADYAASKSGKKYGLFSTRARKRVNNQIAEATRQLNTIEGILTQNLQQQLLSASMHDTMGNAYQNQLQGGYNQANVYAAKRGGILYNSDYKLRAARIAKAGIKFKEDILNSHGWPKHIAKNKDFIKFINTLPEDWKEYSEEHEDLYEIWQENGKPKSFSEATDLKSTPMFILDDAGLTIINPEISESDEQPKSEEPMDYEDFKLEVSKLADTLYFQKGGQLNVIPEGALHAHKHNLESVREDLDGEITHKGIPVVTIAKDGEKVEQQAEIERNEIIFNLEITKQIEELREKYHKAETLKEKDLIAIEAGKLLSDSIIEDTDDRTGLIKQILE